MWSLGAVWDVLNGYLQRGSYLQTLLIPSINGCQDNLDLSHNRPVEQ